MMEPVGLILVIVITTIEAGKGQAYPKQTVSKTKQDLPDKVSKRGNKLEGYKRERFDWYPMDVCICNEERWVVFETRYYLA